MDQHPDTGAIEHVFQAWDDALGAKDLDASMALYHPDATLESPLVCHFLGTEEGVEARARRCGASSNRSSSTSRRSADASGPASSPTAPG